MKAWILDRGIDLFTVCEASGWDRARCIGALVERRIHPNDAPAFVAFAIGEHDFPDAGAENDLAPRLWSRLT